MRGLPASAPQLFVLGVIMAAGDTGIMSDQPANPNDKNAFGVWPGEGVTELPKTYDASLYYIGRIHTPWKERKDCPKNARESEAVCTIELEPRWAAGLKDIASCSHLVVLYWMDKSRRDIVLQMPRHYGVQRGTFSLRSPARPNPNAMSLGRLGRGGW